MAGKNTDPLTLEGVPDVASPVVVSAEQNTSGDREGHGRDSAKDVVVCEGVQLAVCADVEESARCIIRSGGEGIAIGEETEVHKNQRYALGGAYDLLTKRR